MKTNMINSNSIKTYICTIVLMLGFSVSAWGTTPAIDETLYSIDVNSLSFGTVNATSFDYGLIETELSITVTLKSGFSKGSLSMGISDDDNEVFYFDNYNTYKFIVSRNNASTTNDYEEDIKLYLPDHNGDYSSILHIYIQGSGLDEDIEIPLSATVTGVCTAHTISLTNSGTGTNGDFSSDKSSACSSETITLTASPSSGYELDAWTVSKSGGGTCTVTSNQFTMPDVNVTVSATFRAKSYTVNLDREGGTTGATSITVTYNSSTVTGFTAPEKEGYTFGGYYTGDNGTGTQVLSTTGVLQASVTGYTGAGGIWTKTTTPTTLYAKWTINSHKISVSTPIDYVTVTATPSGGSAIAEGSYNDAVNYGTSVALSASSITGGYAFNSWVVTKDDEDDLDVTASVVVGNTLTMPDYDVTVTATMYAKAKLQTRCLAEPEFTVTGSVYLTSYANVEVFTTDNPDNRITITCSDFESANRLYITYLNGSGETVAKASSLFRLCNTDYSKADASNDYIDVSAVDWSEGQKFCIAYKPGAEEYNQTDTWTIRLTAKYGASTDLGHQDLTVHGRALPEEFVVASKFDGQWYALPNTLANLEKDAKAVAGTRITVDNETTPTAATYAPSTVIYRGEGRNNNAANRYGIRLTDGTNHLQVSSTGSNNTMWLSSTGSASCQDWCLTSSDFGYYTVTMPSNTGNESKKIGMYGGNIGYYGSPTSPSGQIYFLPVTNKYTEVSTSVHEWGEHGVIVAADMTNVASVTMNVETASPAAADLSAVNAASLTAGKYVRVYKSDMTVGAIANEGKLLYLHWKNSGGTEIGVSKIQIPCVIAADGVMKTLDGDKAKWAKKEVHVLPGATLTADADNFGGKKVTVPTMYVYPGATLKVSTDTLDITALRLRCGWTRAGAKKYDVARVHIADDAALTKTTASMDYDIYDSGEGTHYYPIAVPFETAVSGIDYVDETLATYSTYGTHYVIKSYDGASRAENGAIDDNWVPVDPDATLQPGVGYIMTGVGLPAYGGCIIRIPLAFDNEWTSDGEKATATIADKSVTKNTVAVTHHTGTAATASKSHEGWNMLGVPYMSCFDADDATHSEDNAFIKGKLNFTTGEYTETTKVYVNVPTHNFSEYIQSPVDEAVLLPGWCFFVQFAETGTLSFAAAGQEESSSLPIYAPQRTEEEAKPVVKTGIILSGNEASDKTTLLISDRYSSEYEIGADLEKMFGNGYTLATYSLQNDTRLAYNAMSTSDAKQIIPIGVRFPEDGEYTFSLNPRYADADIERLDLIDYETGEVTNLMAAEYTFTATRQQNDTRFALNVQQAMQTPTDVGHLEPDRPDEARKILMNGVLYIVRDGLLFDATGKRVTTINK